MILRVGDIHGQWCSWSSGGLSDLKKHGIGLPKNGQVTHGRHNVWPKNSLMLVAHSNSLIGIYYWVNLIRKVVINLVLTM